MSLAQQQQETDIRFTILICNQWCLVSKLYFLVPNKNVTAIHVTYFKTGEKFSQLMYIERWSGRVLVHVLVIEFAFLMKSKPRFVTFSGAFNKIFRMKRFYNDLEKSQQLQFKKIKRFAKKSEEKKFIQIHIFGIFLHDLLIHVSSILFDLFTQAEKCLDVPLKPFIHLRVFARVISANHSKRTGKQINSVITSEGILFCLQHVTGDARTQDRLQWKLLTTHAQRVENCFSRNVRSRRVVRSCQLLVKCSRQRSETLKAPV